MRLFSINIRGRVKNFDLPKNQPLVPLFEAIVDKINAYIEILSYDKIISDAKKRNRILFDKLGI